MTVPSPYPETQDERHPVTVTIARRVAPGREPEFEDWAEKLTGAASRFHGFLGAGLLRPGHVGDEWHVVYRFDSPEHLDHWEKAPERSELLQEGEHLMETVAEHRVSGLETWFSLPGRTAPAPPRWKMFVVSVFAIYTLDLLFHLSVEPAIHSWPLPLRVAALAGTVVSLMTWVVMPMLARAFAPWLYAPSRRS